MRRILAICLLVLAGSVLGMPQPASRAEDEASPDDARAEVARWLDDLRSPEYAVRDAARQALEARGNEARDLLEARRDDPDPEVRRTVRGLLERMGQPVEVEIPPPADITGLGTTHLKRKGTLAALLEALGEPQGARFDLPPDASVREASVDGRGRPLFTVLDELAVAAGLDAGAAFDAGGRLTLTVAGDAAGADADAVPWGAAGPMRVRLGEVTATRVLGSSGGRRYALTFNLHWLPSVQLVQYRNPKDVEALTAAGHAYGLGGATRGNVTYGVSTSSRHHRLSLHLDPSNPAAEERLATLVFTLPVRLRHRLRSVRLTLGEDVELPLSRDVTNEAGPADRITLRALERPDGDRGAWVADLAARVRGETGQRSLQVWLERSDGTVQPASAGSRIPSADGLVELTARAWGQWEAPPAAVLVTWYQLEEEGELVFRLEDVPLR